MRHSSCAAMGSVVSLEFWDLGLIPGLAQWVKDLVLPQLDLAQELHMLWGGKRKKDKN